MKQVFKDEQTVPKEFSPTRALIGILHKESNGTLPIQCIIDWAKSEGRNDISELIKNFEETAREQNQTTKRASESIQSDFDNTSTLVLTRSYDPMTSLCSQAVAPGDEKQPYNDERTSESGDSSYIDFPSTPDLCHVSKGQDKHDALRQQCPAST